MTRFLKIFVAMMLSAALLFQFSGCCGEPTVEQQEASYKLNIDKLDTLKTKVDTRTAKVIDDKKRDFDRDFTKAMNKGSDEEKIEALRSLNSRISTFQSGLNKDKGKKKVKKVKKGTKKGVTGTKKTTTKAAPKTGATSAPKKTTTKTAPKTGATSAPKKATTKTAPKTGSTSAPKSAPTSGKKVKKVIKKVKP